MKNQNDILPAIESENGKCIPKKIKVFKKKTFYQQIKLSQRIKKFTDASTSEMKVSKLMSCISMMPSRKQVSIAENQQQKTKLT